MFQAFRGLRTEAQTFFKKNSGMTTVSELLGGFAPKDESSF